MWIWQDFREKKLFSSFQGYIILKKGISIVEVLIKSFAQISIIKDFMAHFYTVII